MRRAIASAVAVAALAGAALPHSALAQGIIGYDGKNPFDCTLQQLGQGTDFPRPNDDPFCVEYDKRHQNVTELGVVDFLSKEPARVAAASPKCFYFQRDHWVGSVVQGNQQTQTYAWDGSYYFDKARGIGGVYVENFSFNGQTGDPTQLPGFPGAYKPFFGPGRGGVQLENTVPVDQSCVAKAKAKDPRAGGGPGGAAYKGFDRCRVPGGRVDRGLGGIALGMRRSEVRRLLGPPTKESLKTVEYCMVGGGRLLASFTKRGDSGRALLILTDSPPFDARGIRTKQTTHRVRKRLRRFKRLIRQRVEGVRLLARREKRQTILVGARKGRVTYVAVAQRKLKAKRIRRLLRAIPDFP